MAWNDKEVEEGLTVVSKQFSVTGIYIRQGRNSYSEPEVNFNHIVWAEDDNHAVTKVYKYYADKSGYEMTYGLQNVHAFETIE